MIDDVNLINLISDAEERRCRATVMFDRAALEPLLDDDLVWIHASGRVDGKAALLATLERDKPYLGLTISSHTVRRIGDACISTGLIEVVLGEPGAPPPYTNLFTNIWAFDGAQWMLAQGQSTRRAANKH